MQHLPWIHRDPYRCAEDGIFDRLLVAQAIHNGLTLLTADRTLRSYSHQVIWIGGEGPGS